MAEEFIPDETFAGRSIRFWAQYTEAELLADWGLNEKQIPLLKKQLDHVNLKLRDKPKVVAEVPAEDDSAVEELSPKPKVKAKK